MVEVSTDRGTIAARVRIGNVRPGVIFVPFHYGYWDRPRDPNHRRAANELTRTDWDPASKQPTLKVAAASLRSAGSSGTVESCVSGWCPVSSAWFWIGQARLPGRHPRISAFR